MPLLAKARSFFRNLFSFDRRDSDLDQEIRSHLELLIEENIRAGMPPGEAQRAARIELGGSEQVKEQVREARMGNWLHSVAADCRYGLRQLRKNPGFTAVAIVTLAVAIGANAVVFSVLNALILHPLNMPDAESLYGIQHGNEASSYQSYPDYLDLRDRNHSFDGLAAYNAAQAGLDTGENPSRVWLYEVSGNYFDVLGIHPYLGRVFHDSDEHGANSAPYIVLSYAYWHTRFQDDRSVMGHTVQLNKHPFTIVGVAPPEFHGTLVFFNPDFFVPIVNQEQVESENFLTARGKRWVFMTMGHLKAGVTAAQAIADLNSIGSYLEKTYPKDDDQRTFTLARPGLYGDYLGKPMRAFMTGLMLLAGLILLAACANLGSLFAARAADRSREVALRLALGASRTRVLRQLFTEALLLSLLGGAVGLFGSRMLLSGLSVWQPFSKWPVHVPVNPDANVYALALLLTLASGLLFGAVPVRQVLHTDPYEIVKSGSLARVGRRITVRDLLIAVQIAICAVLVTSSMVAVRGLHRSLHSNFGFEPRNVMLVDTELSMADYRGDTVPRMQNRIIDAVEKIAGVESVGLVDAAPLVAGGYNGSLAFTDDSTDLRSSNAAADAFKFSISPEYFHAASTALLSGRTFTWYDDKDSPRVAVVNQEFARKMFGSVTNAVGGYYKMPNGTRVQVVGMVQDGKYRSLTEDPEPAMFLPILQSPSSQTYLAVRSDRDPGQLVAAIRSAVRDLDASLPLYIEPWNKELDSALFPSRVAAMALGVLGIMGAMLSITGIFGMAAYSVSKRLKELGIRMALGAQRKEVLQAALGRAFKLLAFGSFVGLLLGILASRVLSFIVYQATPRDPLVLTGVVLAMASLGLLATWIPARRALSIDPAILLRDE
ncbi:MAG TPA: ABC transporter permease [Candidatus Acidoferrales bacterium]|nr:ABC transporter permease [Candidatus Acidoferrales bacterium]